jgi:spermidine/putrescine transport system substrate-binding protein
MSDRHVDPELEQAIRFARQMSRRRFMVRGGLGLGGLLLGPSLLAACGDDDDGGSGGGSAEGGDGDKEVVFSNWDAYIDEDDNGNVDGPGTTIAGFQEATGIKMTYRKDFNDNDEYFNKIYSPLLGSGKRIDADITAPTYWMAARIIGLGWTEELPLDEIPNHENLEDAYLDLEWDRGAKHFMPWQAGITGIAWNPELVGGDLASANDLFDPKLKGKVAMLTEWRDSVGLTMFGAGDDPSKADLDAINAAMDTIEKAKSDGQILKFTGNEYLRSLENGDIAACTAWSGDIAQLDPELGIKFAIPEEGGMQWFDAMTIAKGSPNRVAAARWMNYVYEPENAAKITSWVQYISPVKGVKDVLLANGGEDAELAENVLIFPDDDTRSRLAVFAELEQEDEIAVQERFNTITS